VTEANLDYEGSVTIDANLLREADILPYEKVAIWNVTRGSRLETYALEAPPGSGVVCVNGAGAHLNLPGDLVIIATFADVDESEVLQWRPRVVFLDEKNRPVAVPTRAAAG
jgi:aspartate 1-decarboxylase